MRYAIEESFIDEVERRLKHVEMRCKRNGNSFSYRRVGQEYREIKEGNIKRNHLFYIIEVDGTAKVDDYEFSAVLSISSSGNIIRKANVAYDIPERFRTSENVCEHCHSKRHRNELYVVRNVKTGEFKQVGSNCLIDYTSGLSAEYVAAYMDGVTELEAYDGMHNNGITGSYYMSVEDILCYAQEAIQKMGYFNSKSDLPTNRIVKMLMENRQLCDRISNINDVLRQNRFAVEFEASDFNRKDTIETVRKIIEYYKTVPATSDFIHNVHVLINEGYATFKDVGYLCYLPQGYAKYINQQIERAQRLKKDSLSSFFGEVKKRYRAESVETFELIRSLDTEFGAMHIYKIVLQSGNILIWKTSTFMNGNQRTNIKNIDFTVKAHDEYKGIKQTEITRAKVVEWRRAA